MLTFLLDFFLDCIHVSKKEVKKSNLLLSKKKPTTKQTNFCPHTIIQRGKYWAFLLIRLCLICETDELTVQKPSTDTVTLV